MSDLEFIRRLRRLIGRRCRYLGRDCQLIEVLADSAAVILSCHEGLPPIQGDQYGQPLRRAAENIQVPLFAADGDNLSDDFIDLLKQLETGA